MGEVGPIEEAYRGLAALRLEVAPEIANDLFQRVEAALTEARRQGIIDFISRQSVVYKRHSGMAVLEDIELAVKEFGCSMLDFYDEEGVLYL